MADRWYVSDHHIGHGNIIKYGERPFPDVKEMNEALVTYHNETVKPEDHVSFLGDVCIWRGGRVQQEMFCNEIRRYNGHKRLYLGNHDHFPVEVYLRAGFEKIYATWRCEEGFICSHYPLHPRSLGSATACVHGHTHQHPEYDSVVFEGYPEDQVMNRRRREKRVTPYINVSVEAINYRPIHLDEILKRIRDAQA